MKFCFIVSMLEVKMIHTKNLRFSYNDMDFEATVTYSDVPFSPRLKENETAFYNVDLHKPAALKCVVR